MSNLDGHTIISTRINSYGEIVLCLDDNRKVYLTAEESLDIDPEAVEETLAEADARERYSESEVRAMVGESY